MKKIIIAISLTASLSSFAETIKVGIYSQVGTVTEFCHVNSGYLFVNGVRVVNNANLGKIFNFEVPANSKLLLRDISIGRGSNECNKLVVEKEDGSELRVSRALGTVNFEIEL